MSLVTELKRRNVLRVVAAYLVVGWLLTEVLTAILPTLGAPEWTARAVILLFAFGFIPTVVLSWVYELTPEGIKREQDIDRDGDVERTSLRKLDYVTIGAIFLIVVFAAFFSANQDPDDYVSQSTEVSNESVAVLPFVNMSKDEDNEYFSDGLTETLLHMLAQVPDLKVAARTSSFAFKGKNIDIREIAESLQVAHVLEGSVQQVGDRVRVTAQLIRAADGYHVWSANYDRTMDDIFKIQDEIAIKVGSALSASLLGPGSARQLAGVDTESPDAYDMYLQALKERSTFSFGGLQAGEQLLKGALMIDAGFLEAKIELASNYLQQFETGLMSYDDAFAQVQALTGQVLAVRPDDVAARSLQLFLDANPQTRIGGAEVIADAIQQLGQIVRENPSEYSARIMLTRLLQNQGEFERALALQLEVLEGDPFNARVHYEVGSLYLHLGKLDEARDALQKSLDIEPRQPNAYLNLARAAQRAGDGVEFLRQNLKAMEVDPRDHEIPGSIAAFLYEMKLTEAGDEFRNMVIATAPTSEVAYAIELLRAKSMEDRDASIVAARRTITDDVDNRHDAYSGAIRFLFRDAASNGTVDELSAWLDEQAPGILDIEVPSVPSKYRIVQGAAFDAWFITLPRQDLLDRIEKMLAILKSYGRDPLEDPATKMDVHSMRGETAQAISVALAEVFAEPVLVNMNWRADFAQAQFRDLISDDRVKAALRNWEAEESEQRERVQNFLADLSSAS